MARELEALEYEMLLSIPILTVVPCDLPELVSLVLGIQGQKYGLNL